MSDQLFINVEMQDAVMPMSPEECMNMYGMNQTSEGGRYLFESNI